MRRRIGALLASASGYAIGAALGTFYSGPVGITPAMAMLAAYRRTLTDEVAAYEATYTGASHKTMFDHYGLLTYAPNNLFANNTSATGWTGGSVTDGVADPDGGTNALTLTATANSQQIYKGIGVTSASNAIVAVRARRRSGTGAIRLYNAQSNLSTEITLTDEWKTFYVWQSAPTTAWYFDIFFETSGDAIDIYQASVAKVTHETVARSCDMVLTTGSAYYGPRFVYAPETLQTSSTSITIGSGSEYTFAVADESLYAVGNVVQATDNANPDNWVRGYVISTASGSVTLGTYTFPGTAYSRPVLTNGSGTISNWSVIRSVKVLREDAETNLLVRSRDLSTTWVAWAATTTTNAISSPSGEVDADYLVETSTTTKQGRYQNVGSLTDGATYCFATWVRAVGRNYAHLLVCGAGANDYYAATYDLTTGTVSKTGAGSNGAVVASGIIKGANGWYLVWIAGTVTTGAATTLFPTVCASDSATPTYGTFGAVSYAGAGTAALAYWGMQFVAGSYPSSFIPTVASQVARASETISLTGADFSVPIDTTKGTFVVEFTPENDTSFDALAVGSGSSAIYARFLTSKQVFIYNTSIIATLTMEAGAVVPFQTYKIAFSYNTDDFKASIDGATAAIDTSGTPATMTALYIAGNQAVAMNGGVGSVLYFRNTEDVEALSA